MVKSKLKDCRAADAGNPASCRHHQQAGHRELAIITRAMSPFYGVDGLWRGWSLGLALGAASLNAAVSSPSTWEALGAIYAFPAEVTALGEHDEARGGHRCQADSQRAVAKSQRVACVTLPRVCE